MFRNIEKYGYNSVDILSLFEKLTLDAIGIAGFGESIVLPYIESCISNLLGYKKIFISMPWMMQIINGCATTTQLKTV